MRISDWSSDVCSSDLALFRAEKGRKRLAPGARRLSSCFACALRFSPNAGRHQLGHPCPQTVVPCSRIRLRCSACFTARGDRKSVVWGKSVSVRVDLGGRRILKKKKKKNKHKLT